MVCLISVLITLIVSLTFFIFTIDFIQSKKRYMLIMDDDVYYFKTFDEMELFIKTKDDYSLNYQKFVEVDGKYIYLGGK